MLRCCVVTILMVCVIPLTGCLFVPPVPVPKRIEGPDTSKVPELGIIRPGVTTREEVVQHFKSVDTGVTPGMFWGRYIKSTWSNPGAYRSWGRENMLVEFDEKGIVTMVRTVGDSKINQILVDWLSKQPRKTASTAPVRFRGKGMKVWTYESYDADFALLDDKFEYVGHQRDSTQTVSVPPRRITRIKPYGLFEYDLLKNDLVEEEIWIDTAELHGQTLTIRLKVVELMLLLDYLRLHSPVIKFE